MREDVGAGPVGGQIQAPQPLAVAKSIEDRGAVDVAKRSLQTTGQIQRYAVADGLGERNPVAQVKPADALKRRRIENDARVDAREMPDLLPRIEAYQGNSITRLAMKQMSLTFARTSELIGARWEEFDLAALKRMGYAGRMTGHGLRGVASTILHEHG